MQSLGIDRENFNISQVYDSEPLLSINSWIEIVILFDPQFSSSEQQIISNFVNTGGGVIVFMGQNLHYNATLLEELELIDNTLFENQSSDAADLLAELPVHIVHRNLGWRFPHFRPSGL